MSHKITSQMYDSSKVKVMSEVMSQLWFFLVIGTKQRLAICSFDKFDCFINIGLLVNTIQLAL